MRIIKTHVMMRILWRNSDPFPRGPRLPSAELCWAQSLCQVLSGTLDQSPSGNSKHLGTVVGSFGCWLSNQKNTCFSWTLTRKFLYCKPLCQYQEMLPEGVPCLSSDVPLLIQSLFAFLMQQLVLYKIELGSVKHTLMTDIPFQSWLFHRDPKILAYYNSHIFSAVRIILYNQPTCGALVAFLYQKKKWGKNLTKHGKGHSKGFHQKKPQLLWPSNSSIHGFCWSIVMETLGTICWDCNSKRACHSSSVGTVGKCFRVRINSLCRSEPSPNKNHPPKATSRNQKGVVNLLTTNYPFPFVRLL